VFDKFSKCIAHMAGKSITFALSMLMIVVWAVTGPLFDFSDTWQLVINTSTTIVTFLMVFVIQNTQNRDTEALQLKLDELILIHTDANNALLDIEELTDERLLKIRERYLKLAEKARKAMPGNTSEIEAHVSEIENEQPSENRSDIQRQSRSKTT